MHQVIHEDPHCYWVRGSDGGLVPIPKGALDAATKARLAAGVAKATEPDADDAGGAPDGDTDDPPLRMATGGLPLGDGEHLTVDPATGEAVVVPAPDPVADELLDVNRPSTALPFVSPDQTVPDPILADRPAFPSPPAPSPGDTSTFLQRLTGTVPPGAGGTGTPIFTAMDAADAARKAPGDPHAFMGLVDRREGRAPAPPAPEPLPAPAPAPAAQPRTPEGGGFRIPGAGPLPPPDPALGDSFTRQDIAQRQLQHIVAAEDLRKSALAEQSRLDQAKFDADTAAQVAARQAQADQMKNEIRAGKIDPNKMYASLDSAQRVGLGISLFLGGFGAAFTGGPNQALAIFNKRIDDDLNAQQAELGKKQSLLSQFIAEGNTIQHARELARAHMLDGIAATMERDAADFGSQKAPIAALDASAQLSRAAAESRAKAGVAGREDQFKRAQIANLYSEAAKNAAAAGDLSRKHGADAATGDVLDRLAVGAPVDNREIARLDPKVREAVVTLPNGHKFLVQGGVKTAEDTRAVVSGAQEIQSIVSEARALREKYGNEWLNRGAVAASGGLRERFTLALKNIEHLRAITDNEREIAHTLFPDVSNAQTDASVDAKLDQALRGAQVKLQTHLASVGYRGSATTPIRFSTE